MNAPDRRIEVRQIWETTFNRSFVDENERRNYLLTVLIPALNRMETQGEWGALLKTDRQPPPGTIPADTIVWKETMEHFDALTDTGPYWKAHGPVTHSKWIFYQVGSQEPQVPTEEPSTGETPTGNIPPTVVTAALLKLDNISEQVRVLTESHNQFVDLVAEALSRLILRVPPDYTGKLLGMNVTLKPKIGTD